MFSRYQDGPVLLHIAVGFGCNGMGQNRIHMGVVGFGMGRLRLHADAANPKGSLLGGHRHKLAGSQYISDLIL